MADFVPPADDAKIIWLTNLRDTIDDWSAILGLTAARVTQIKAWCNELIAEINATNTDSYGDGVGGAPGSGASNVNFISSH